MIERNMISKLEKDEDNKQPLLNWAVEYQQLNENLILKIAKRLKNMRMILRRKRRS